MGWQDDIRKQFPVCGVQTYLDSGLSNGGCKASLAAVEKFFEESFAGQMDGKKHWNQAVQDVRELSARLLGGVSPENIALLKNTVEGFNTIAQGFPWQEGDNIIINDQEHTSNLMPWLALKHKGVSCKVVKSINYELPVETIEAAMDEHTRIVAISHVQNATGYKSDLKRLAEICHRHNAFLIVDAIQSLGLTPCDAKEWDVDAVSAGGHKCLLSVPGIGIFYVSPRLLSILRPAYAGFSSVCTVDKVNWENTCSDENSAKKLEHSNLNYLGAYSLRAGLELILNTGVDRIWENVSFLSDKLNRTLREIGYTVVTPDSLDHRASIVSVAVPDPLGMKTWFAERGIAISKMDAGYCRFSLGIFSTEEDVDKALEAAKAYYSQQIMG